MIRSHGQKDGTPDAPAVVDAPDAPAVVDAAPDANRAASVVDTPDTPAVADAADAPVTAASARKARKARKAGKAGRARASKSIRRNGKPKRSREHRKQSKSKPKRQLVSADGTPYSLWQRRTRVLCILLLVYGCIEVASGIVFVCLGYGLGFWLGDVAGGLSIRLQTLIFGVYNLMIALLGLRGAKDPKKATPFFWTVLANVVLMAWQLASEISLHVFELSSMITFVVMFAFALCAWKLREQTGYFDNHPMPEDEQGM